MLALLALVALTMLGCSSSGARPLVTWPSLPAGDEVNGPLCGSLLGRFMGLPTAVESTSASAEEADAMGPLAGRWWIRTCAVESVGENMQLRLGGPAWYWVDQSSQGFRIRQSVSLAIETRLVGSVDLDYRRGVVSLRFVPTGDAHVGVRVTDRVDVRAQTFWTSLIRSFPFAQVVRRAERRISRKVAEGFEERLNEGAVVTYDLSRGQAELALGRAVVGKKPRRPFDETARWLANERQLLYPGGMHLIGPFAPAERIPLDVLVESGPGLAYGAACARDVERTFDTSRRGAPTAPPQIIRQFGLVRGPGLHNRFLTVQDCQWYLLTATPEQVPSVAALRLRPAPTSQDDAVHSPHAAFARTGLGPTRQGGT